MHMCWLSFCDMASSWLDSFQCFDMFWRPICQGGVNCMAWDATISFLGSLCWCDLHALSERTCIVVLAVIKRVYMLRHCSLRGHPAQDITCYTSATSPTCMIAHRGFDAAYLAITNSACRLITLVRTELTWRLAIECHDAHTNTRADTNSACSCHACKRMQHYKDD